MAGTVVKGEVVEQVIDQKHMIGVLTKSAHGDLKAYLVDGLLAVQQDPEFFGHLLAWNHRKGSIRDSKLALPVVALMNDSLPRALQENSLALLADLPPFLFVRAMDFAREQGVMSRTLRRLVTRYLRDLEADRRTWDRVAVQHRDALRRLYGLFHVAPGGGTKDQPSHEDVGVMKHQAKVGKFAAVRTLSGLPALQIGAVVAQHRIPFLIARGALGARAKESDVALALIKSMSPAELVTNTRALVRLGVKTDGVLRAAFEEGLARAGKKPRKGVASLKATKAAEILKAEDPVLSTKLHALQETQLRQMGGIEGDWLVLADRSGSMAHAIEVARQVSGVLARMVQGQVHLVFFDTAPRAFDVTGQTYEQIKGLTALVAPGGSTSIGCGLDYVRRAGRTVDGIAIVSDGGQNHPPDFPTVYGKYVKEFDIEPTVYFYKVPGDPDTLTKGCQQANIPLETFDLRNQQIDYYSLPALVQTMRVNRYLLADEILATPLATLDQVLDKTVGMKVVLDVPVPV